jgi:hypothetical protein
VQSIDKRTIQTFMKKAFKPELARTINRQAHILAAQSFAPIRMKLEEKAKALLKDGATLEDTLKVIRVAGLQTDGMEL